MKLAGRFLPPLFVGHCKSAYISVCFGGFQVGYFLPATQKYENDHAVCVIMSESKSLPTIQGVVFAPFKSSEASTLSPLEQKLFHALHTQAGFMEQIVTRNKDLYSKLNELKREIKQLQGQCNSSEEVEGQTAELPSKESVLDVVSSEEQAYSWSLELDGQLPEPLCKGKYFQFKVKLVPTSSDSFPVEERIQLSVSIYSAEKTPRPIVVSMAGGPLVKGYPESMLSYSPSDKCHVAYFKIQICEVSSHFRNGWVFLVIQPKYTGGEDSMVSQIRPLVIENVVVRAKEISTKRLKKKSLTAEEEIIAMDLMQK